MHKPHVAPLIIRGNAALALDGKMRDPGNEVGQMQQWQLKEKSPCVLLSGRERSIPVDEMTC